MSGVSWEVGYPAVTYVMRADYKLSVSYCAIGSIERTLPSFLHCAKVFLIASIVLFWR